jgi:hypothetical protein
MNISQSEKRIIESFKETYNKIKRLDEGSLTGVSDMLITLDYDNDVTKIEEKHYHNGPDNSIDSEIDTLATNFDFDDTLSIVEDLISKHRWNKIYVKAVFDGEEHEDRIDARYWKGLNFWLKNISETKNNGLFEFEDDFEKQSREVQYGINPYQEMDIINDEISFESYIGMVKDELNRLDSGEIILMVIDGNFTGPAEKYKNSSWAKISKYIYQNYTKKIPAEKTANYLRDSWFGV